MRTVADVVYQIIEKDTEVEYLGRKGLINLAQYAKVIKKQVESDIGTTVSANSIQMALSRYFKNATKKAAPEPTFTITGLSIHPNLEAIAVERTAETSHILQEFYSEIASDLTYFLTATQGVREITLIADSYVAINLRRKIEKVSTIKVIYDLRNLTGITVKSSLEYVEKIGWTQFLVNRICMKNIVIVETITTATETTFILYKQDVGTALAQLQQNLA